MTKAKVRQLHEDPLDFVLANLLRIVRTRRAEVEALVLFQLRKHLDMLEKTGTDEIKQIAASAMAFSGIDPSGMLDQAMGFVRGLEAELDNAKTEEKKP